MKQTDMADDLLARVLKEPVVSYGSDDQLLLFDDGVLTQGQVLDIRATAADQNPQPFYRHPNGEIFVGDSLLWMRSLPDASVDLIVADPPYNISKAEWDTFESQQAYVAWSVRWIEQASRILTPTGTLYICGFSEILADIKLPALQFFAGCRWIVWHYKNKANLRADWGRSHESILHFRKGKSFTFVVAEQLKRRWKGCELSVEYCRWAIQRLERVPSWPIEKWIDFDLQNTLRRRSIR